jgi:hypothetical protein
MWLSGIIAALYNKLGRTYEIDYTITEYKARGQAYSGEGGNVIVLAHITCLYVLAWTSISGIERQNSVFIYKPNFVNNFFFLALNGCN